MKLKIITIISVALFSSCSLLLKEESADSGEGLLLGLLNSAPVNPLSSATPGNETPATPTIPTVLTVETPVISPTSGIFSQDQTVTITTNTSGASIYYTVNGNTPTISDTLYTGSIPINGNGTSVTIKAIAVKTGYENSSIATSNIAINYSQVSTPIVSLDSGTYLNNTQVSITNSTIGAIIYYTLDGNVPTASSTQYTGAITLTSNVTLKVIAIKPGMQDSTVVVKNYTVGVGYTISGSVYSMPNADSIVLKNGTEEITVSSNTTFSFSPIVNGQSYNVYIKTQPTNAYCVITNNTGTITNNVTNVRVDCPAIKSGGKIFDRCTFGQVWNPSTNDCTGVGNSGSGYGAISFRVRYCSVRDNSCNGGITGNNLDGNGTSTAYSACNSMNTANGGTGTYGKTTWRVPTKSELYETVYCTGGHKTPYGTGCNNGVRPSVNQTLYPNTQNYFYWVTESSSTNNQFAWTISADVGTPIEEPKDMLAQVRCVAD